jgi:hypothetical protein
VEKQEGGVKRGKLAIIADGFTRLYSHVPCKLSEGDIDKGKYWWLMPATKNRQSPGRHISEPEGVG